MRLVVYYADYPSNQASKDFMVEIIDYCVPSSVTKTSQFTPSSLSYTLGEPSVQSVMGFWTTVPEVCNIEYFVTVTPTPDDLALITAHKTASEFVVTAGTSDEQYGFEPQIFTVEVRAWADNNHDTLVFT